METTASNRPSTRGPSRALAGPCALAALSIRIIAAPALSILTNDAIAQSPCVDRPRYEAAAASGAAQIDPRLAEAVYSVRIDSLLASVRVLAGADTYVMGGEVRHISTRDDGSQGNERAAEWLVSRLEGFGLDVTDHRFWDTGRNIIAFQRPPCDLPGQSGIVMLSAHYDAVRRTPGADDNGSGTAAVLEAARVLSRLELARTVAYALWDSEESGLHGSRFYATEAAAAQMDLRWVLNLDMIGWDGDGDRRYAISAPWPGLEDLLETTNRALSLGLVLGGQQSIGSDHYSFTRAGFQATSISEPFGDFNIHYHGPDDTTGNLNADFYARTSMLATAVVAQLAMQTDQAAHGDRPAVAAGFALEAWPSPARDGMTIGLTAASATRAILRIHDVLGRSVWSADLGIVPPGLHREQVDVSAWAPGVYVVRITAAGHAYTLLAPVVR